MNKKIESLSKEDLLELTGLLVILAHNGRDVVKSLDIALKSLKDNFGSSEEEALSFIENRVNDILNLKSAKKQLKSTKPSKKEIHLWTDGSSHNNEEFKGLGGFGYVLLYGDFSNADIHTEYCSKANTKVGWGEGLDTTNQREEIKAVIRGLQRITTSQIPIEVFSDSAYVINCMNQKWYNGWIKNGWKNSKNQPVSNRDLWEELLQTIKDNKLDVKFTKIKGHDGSYYNELADDLAKQGLEIAKEAFKESLKSNS